MTAPLSDITPDPKGVMPIMSASLSADDKSPHNSKADESGAMPDDDGPTIFGGPDMADINDWEDTVQPEGADAPDEREADTFDLPCALCDGRGWIDNLYAPSAGKSRGGPCPRCDEGLVTVAVTAQMVEAAINAGPNGIKGCEYAPGQFCGGTHTDCYYRGIVEAALGAAYNEPLVSEPRGATDAF
jgi:hypothetical protein